MQKRKDNKSPKEKWQRKDLIIQKSVSPFSKPSRKCKKQEIRRKNTYDKSDNKYENSY
jgi:hypothetical protein